MASVIGILFFVVLLMALDMVTAHAGSGVPVASIDEDHLEALKHQLAEVRRRERVLENEIQRMGDALELAATDEKGLLQDIKGLHGTLKGMYARIAEDQERLAQMQHDADKNLALQRRCGEEVGRLDRQLAELKHQLAVTGRGPRISYIIDTRADAKKPWLIEVTADGFRASDGLDSSSHIEFKAADAGERIKQLMQWAMTKDADDEYFVLLTKPSGQMLSEILAMALRASGYEFGTDLLPEAWEPF